MSATALTGIHAQAARLAALASKVAEPENEDPQPIEGSSATNSAGYDDLGSAMAELPEAENAYRANIAAFDAGADMWAMLSVIQRD